jgi:type IX secretion system PorP/SprF family membrane protein
VFNVGNSKAQDPAFSQSFSSALNLNPALTGFTGFTRIQASQRIQWPELPSAYYTTYLAADFSSKGDKFGFGISTMYDNAGSNVLTTFSQTLNFAYRLKFSDNSALRFGLGLGWSSRSIRWEGLIFGDEIDPRFGYVSTTPQTGPSRSTVIFGRVNVGVFFQNKFLYAGYSVFNVNEPNQSFSTISSSKLPMRHSVQVGAKVYQNDNEDFRISLAGVLYRQQDFQTLLLGINSMYKRIGLGLMYRNKDAFIAALSYNQKRFQVRYSYDLTVSRLTNQTGGAHEFSLGFILGKGRDARVNGTWIQNQF